MADGGSYSSVHGNEPVRLNRRSLLRRWGNNVLIHVATLVSRGNRFSFDLDVLSRI